MKRITDRWLDVDRIFTAALDVSAAGRPDFVQQACGGDAGLCATVSALLTAAERTDTFLDSPGPVLPAELLYDVLDDIDGATPARDGERVGRYRLVRELGRGGTGTVFLAERDDGEFTQRVAIKVLRRGLDTDDILARFRAERQILASLNHPNIARLLDGGATADGRPFLVMEYVDGPTITEYCDARQLPIDARIALFETVARAVGHAHHNLVVHRDLKPSNILVAADGTVKLLDFGIAKLLDDAAAATPTRTGVRLMTPEYASPEQLRGEMITTASDIHQLGALLHELLFGHRPSSVAAAEPDGSARRRGSAARRLRARLRGDLDTITRMALHAEPARRYESVGHLLDDLHRYRTGLPVLARPDRWTYRAQKFVRRHPGRASFVAALVLLMSGYVVTLTLHADRLAAERDRARYEAARADEIGRFLLGVFEVADPGETRGQTVTARELLDAAARRARVELATQPELQAAMLSAMVDVYQNLGLYSRAEPLIEDALRIREELHVGDHPAVLESLLQLATQRTRSMPAGKDSVFAVALAMAERLYGPTDTVAARVAAWWGQSIDIAREPEQRMALFERALAILRAHPGEVRVQLAAALAGSASGRGVAGVDRMRQALELQREIYGEDSHQAARTLANIGLALEYADPPAADSLLRRALAMHRAAAGDAHTSTLTIANNLAAVLRDRGDYAEAEPLYREILELRRLEHPDDPVPAGYTLYGLGVVLTGLGRPAEAESYLREASGIFPPGDSRHESIRRALGRALTGQRRWREAETLLLPGLEWARATRAGTNEEADAIDAVVHLYEKWGRPEIADRYRALRRQPI